MERIIDIDKKYIFEKRTDIYQINELIYNEIQFYSVDGNRICIVLRQVNEFKEIIYFDKINEDDYQIFLIAQTMTYSFGVFSKSILKRTGQILREYSDKRINVKVINQYLQV